jgi:hypothetical protein
MSQTARVLFFIGSLMLIIIGLAMLQIWSNNTGRYYPKWPALPLIFILYQLFFPKNKDKQVKK